MIIICNSVNFIAELQLILPTAHFKTKSSDVAWRPDNDRVQSEHGYRGRGNANLDEARLLTSRGISPLVPQPGSTGRA